MDDKRFIISDASKQIDVEPHTLRYWEEELEVEIPRNEMGHRYYTEHHIKLFRTVRILKEQGFQLKAIKMLLPDIDKVEKLDPQSILSLREELNEKAFALENAEGIVEIPDGTSIATRASAQPPSENGISEDKMGQFKAIMNTLIADALKENNPELSASVSGSVIKEMDYLFRLKDEKEDERFKKFDETLREYQKMRVEAAASGEVKPRKAKKRIFKRNKREKRKKV